MRGLLRMKYLMQLVQEQKMRICTTALCRSLLDAPFSRSYLAVYFIFFKWFFWSRCFLLLVGMWLSW